MSLKDKEDITRIIYWWRRYEGKRDKVFGKIWSPHDINILHERIIRYLEHPEEFNYDNPDMGIDRYGFKGEFEG